MNTNIIIPTPNDVYGVQAYKKEIDITLQFVVDKISKREKQIYIHTFPYKQEVVIKEVIIQLQTKGWKIKKESHPYDWREDNSTNDYLSITY